MNNQNYNPQQQPYPQQPYQQQPYPQPQIPQQPPKPAKKSNPIFGGDMLTVLACSASILGFSLVVLGAIVASRGYAYIESTLQNFGTYGTILVIFGILFSAGGTFLSFLFGNKNIQSGKPRGTAATLGLVFGLVGVLLGMFAVFFTGCSACVACEADKVLKK